MVCISLLSIAVEFITCEHGPVLLVSIRLGLEEALPLEDILLILLVIAKALNRHRAPRVSRVIEIVQPTVRVKLALPVLAQELAVLSRAEGCR